MVLTSQLALGLMPPYVASQRHNATSSAEVPRAVSAVQIPDAAAWAPAPSPPCPVSSCARGTALPGARLLSSICTWQMEGVQPLTVHWLSPACLQVTFLAAQEGTLSGLACSLSNQTSSQEWTPGLLTLQQLHPQLCENSLGESHGLSVVTL